MGLLGRIFGEPSSTRTVTMTDPTLAVAFVPVGVLLIEWMAVNAVRIVRLLPTLVHHVLHVVFVRA